jgi:hypothetical protein
MVTEIENIHPSLIYNLACLSMTQETFSRLSLLRTTQLSQENILLL